MSNANSNCESSSFSWFGDFDKTNIAFSSFCRIFVIDLRSFPGILNPFGFPIVFVALRYSLIISKSCFWI